jgi:isoleucyl-tRNA synthetase
MDYKNTLNLPQTDFSMKADLVTREPERLKAWQQAGLYQQIQARRAGALKFVLHDGPPFANGDVHIGTALNKILKDIIIKYQTLRGNDAPYVPGWDCHGLPIEAKVSQELRKAGNETADAATIRTACDAYARKYIDLQRSQFKRLGVFGDWENPYLTLNKEYEAAELCLFADIVAQGFVYRGKKPVYWSIPYKTALAEAEVEYNDHVSQSVYVKFPVVGQPGLNLLIWTTTPWTLPANLAVAYNPKLYYSLVQADGAAYIACDALLGKLAEKCGWNNWNIVRSLGAEDFAAMEYQHPFCNRTGKLYPADFVEDTAGTGFVHIAPGHGAEDYNLGRSLGLPVYSPVDDNGCLAHTNDLPAEQQMPAELIGLSTLEKHGESDANRGVLHILRVGHFLAHEEKYHHSYPHCWRSKTPIIFRAMDQWFIKIDHPVGAESKTFRQCAIEEIDRVTWVPDWGVNRIKGAVQSRPDWCISRQRTWGVPIPAFYDAEKNAILDPAVIRNVAALVEKHGSNVWFEKSATELWALVKPADWKGADAVTRSNDTLDVWIDSGSSSRAVIAARSELRGKGDKPFQADVYLEGSDQHRGWFQSSLLLSLAGNGAAPYKTVLTHGFMVDADREKISKSKQSGYEKPQTAEAYVKQWGADVVRLWVSSQDYRSDIVVSEERIKKVAETYRGIRNSLRYQLSNLFDFNPAKDTVADDQLKGLDRWILGEFAKLEEAVLAAYNAYEFHVVYQKLSQFVAVELSSVYHDVIKDRLYTDPANSLRRRSSQTALHRIVTSLCQMLAPLLAYTADEAWEFIPGNKGTSVHASDWKPNPFNRSEAEQDAWKTLFALREAAMPELEKARQAKLIGKALDANLTLTGKPEALKVALLNEADLRELFNVSQLTFVENGTDEIAFTVDKASGQKCERCWHWENDIGQNAEHTTLCGRCVEAVKVSLSSKA